MLQWQISSDRNRMTDMRPDHLSSRSLSFALLAAMLLAGSCFSGSSLAQNLYRCGSSYQDRPCDNGQTGQVIKKNPSPSTSDKPPLDSTCVRRGEEAKKIIWMREGGAFQDKLLAEARSEEQRKIITDVYAQRGNANDIRSRIESDCMADKEAARKSGTPTGYDSNNRMPDPAPVAADDSKGSGRVDSNEAARKKQLCDNMRSQIAGINASQRAGADGRQMDSMSKTKRELESSLKDQGCGR